MPASCELLEHTTSNQSWIITEARLSICLRADGFSFSITNNRYELCQIGRFRMPCNLGVADTIAHIREAFNSIQITMFRFLSVVILLPSEKHTWIPRQLYDPQQEKTYFGLVAQLDTSETLLRNTIPNPDAISLYAYPTQIVHAWKIVIPNAQFISTQQRIATYAYSIAIEDTQTVILNKRGDQIDLAVFQNIDFKGTNTHRSTSFTDHIYYILFTLKQMKIDTETLDAYLIGDPFTDEEHRMLSQVLNKVKVLHGGYGVKIDHSFQQSDLSPYFLLLQ